MMAFTYCQIPILYKISDADEIEVNYKNGTQQKISGNTLSKAISDQVFKRQDEVDHILVMINQTKLK